MLFHSVQLDDPINVNTADPLKSKKMYGCADWCEESGPNFITENVVSPRRLGMFCKDEIFHTTREEYAELLRQRELGVLTNRQIREHLLKTATVKRNKHSVCADGLYCATIAQPMIESLIVTQQYQFRTGAKPCAIPIRAPVLA